MDAATVSNFDEFVDAYNNGHRHFLITNSITIPANCTVLVGNDEGITFEFFPTASVNPAILFRS